MTDAPQLHRAGWRLGDRTTCQRCGRLDVGAIGELAPRCVKCGGAVRWEHVWVRWDGRRWQVRRWRDTPRVRGYA